MPIHIRNQQKKISLIPARIHDIAKKILQREGIRRYELSIAFVTDRTMRTLNRTYHGCDYPTDVLTFDFMSVEMRSLRRKKANINGEIIISTSTAYRQAKQFQTTPHQEIILYLIHGILHLLGYDDHSSRDRKIMRRKESELMDRVKDSREKKHDR